jgi:hypothetical protein
MKHHKPQSCTRRILFFSPKEDSNMKTQLLVVTALAAMASAISAPAHQIDPGGKIEVACASDTVRMAAISSAVEKSHYWAPQTARRQMLSIARQACARGATVVSFVPPADQRTCQTAPTWSTLCLDRSTRSREAPDRSMEIVP